MYLRTLKNLPELIIQNGKANFGTYNGITQKLDIRGMHAPYAGIPLPAFISNLRIKSKLTYVFALDKYIGKTDFFDFKVIGLAQIVFWNKETGKKNVYHVIMPTRRRFVPVKTNRGICASYRKSRYLKISWGRQHQHHAMSFKVKGDSVRANAEGYFYSPMQDMMHNDTLFVSPAPTSSRCSATWVTPMSIQGHIAINNEQADDSNGLALMLMNRTYYKSHSRTNIAYGLGNIKGKNIIFVIKTSNMDAHDADNYCQNLLTVDGENTILPPVYITHPFGIDKNWIIQDTENMIDLTFTPVNVNSKTVNLIALRSEYSDIYGTFEGVLLTKSGEKIVLKNFPGILYKNIVRL